MQAEEQGLTLAPGERVTLLLRLRVRRPGALTLRGLEWTLNGHACGRRLFEPRRARGRRGRCCPGVWACGRGRLGFGRSGRHAKAARASNQYVELAYEYLWIGLYKSEHACAVYYVLKIS